MADIGAQWEAVARMIFEQAVKENRCGDLLTCLFDGGSATVEPGKGLVLLDAVSLKQLQARHLDRASGHIASHFEKSGRDLSALGFTVGRWTEDVCHADPCDCDLDEEIVGDRCMDASVWFWALMRDEGGHGWSMAFRLSEPGSCRDRAGWTSPSPPASTSPNRGEIPTARPALQGSIGRGDR